MIYDVILTGNNTNVLKSSSQLMGENFQLKMQIIVYI